MLVGAVRRVFTGGPAGPAGATLAAALQDVAASIKAVLTAPDLASARAALGLGNVANLAPADLPVSSAASVALALKAPLASPAFTGAPTAPTPAAGDATTAVATTSFVAAAIAALVNGSPAALDTLKELADALGDDPNFAATLATQLGLKAPLASPALTGSPTAPTATGGTNTPQIATCAFVQAALGPYLTSVTAAATYATLASPALTGAPTAPTPTAGDSSTKIATTAFVGAALGSYLTTSAATATYAPLASPAFTGTPTVPTATPGANTTQAASTAFVTAAVSAATGGTSNAVLYSAQSLASGDRDQVRANLLSAVPYAPSTNATLVATDQDRPITPTAAVTVTMANGGAGWRSGPVCNTTALQAIVTLAVPASATLDGVANGTTKLFPYQKARLLQTGATAYVTDWIDRTPVIGTPVALASGSAVAAIDFALPAGYSTFELRAKEVMCSVSGAQLFGRISFDGTTIVTATNYASFWVYGYGSYVQQAGQSNQDHLTFNVSGFSTAAGYPALFARMTICPGGGSLAPSGNQMFQVKTDVDYVDASPAFRKEISQQFYTVGTSRAALLRLYFSTGNISGQYTLVGHP